MKVAGFFLYISRLLAIAATAGAADLTVQVTDPQHEPIPGANVSVIARGGGRLLLTTDDHGTCLFQNVAPGQYFVQSEAAGFDPSPPQAVEITPQADVHTTILLGLAKVRSSIVVTASGMPQPSSELAKALDVVDEQTMRLRSDMSVAEALEGMPGMHIQQLGGPLSTVYFKTWGLRNQDTAVLVDGLRLRDAAAERGDATGILQDLVIANPSRIEVLRGAGSALYGTDAIGGAVNIVSDEGGGRTRGSVSIDGGSLGSIRGIARLAGGFRQDRVQYSLGVTHWNVMSGIDGDSPARNTSGQAQWTYRPFRNALLSARIYEGDSFGFLRISPQPLATVSGSGITNAIAVSDSELHRYETGTPISQLSLGRATFLPDAFDPDSTRAGRFFTGAFRFTARPWDAIGITGQYQHVSSRRDYGDGPAGAGFQPQGNNISRYRGNIDTAVARVDASLGRFQQIDAGYEFEREEFLNRVLPPPPTSSFFGDISQRSNAIFAQDQLRFFNGRFELTGAYRGQFFALDRPRFDPPGGAPYTGSTFPSPPSAQTGDLSAAYAFRTSGTRFRVHAGRAYRAPSLYERFGVYFDGFGYSVFGDPRLRPDRSRSIDGGLDQTLWNSRAQISATYFYTRLNEVIAFGSINTVADTLARGLGYYNTGGGIARGVEVRSSVAASRSLQISAAYTYTDARQQKPVTPGVWQTYDVPRHEYSISATERFSPRWSGYFLYTASSGYLTPIYGQAFRFDGRSRAQAGASYRRPLSEFRALRFFVKGDNLGGQRYFEDGFRTPGRTVTSGTQFEF